MSKIIPYKGREPYIFISYAHKDGAEVRSVLARMQKDGYRLWFDEGIDPGTEWDDVIAAHVKKCDYFIAFMSENYLASDNCKDELNYARDLGKKQLLVYLCDVELPDGMAMRLGRLQNVGKHRYASEDDFYEKLYDAEGLSAFRSSSGDACAKGTVEQEPSVSEGLRFGVDKETGGLSVSGIDDTAGADIVIPAAYKGKPVTRISPMAFAKRTQRVLSVTLPASVVSVDTAFSRCRGLGKLVVDAGNPRYHVDGNCLIETKKRTLVAGFDNSAIPADGSVTEIGPRAFEGCRGKVKITVPDAVVKIGAYAFSSCPQMSYAELPATLKLLLQGVFKGSKGVTDLFYAGTCSDWKTLERLSRLAIPSQRWDDGMSSYTVHCADGKIEMKKK